MTPEGWRDVSILDVADVASGQVDPRETPYCDWPLVAPNHIEEGSGRLLPAFSAAAQGAISGKYMFQPGDVLYSKIRPYLRKVALPRFSGLCSADMYPLRSNGGIEPGFLFAMLLSKEFTEFASSVSMRTGIPKINREELAKYRCSLPPLPEQRKIAAILSSVDDAIEASQVVIDQIQVVKKAMMAELLTKGLPGRHKRFKQTEIGEVPEDWEIRRVDGLAAPAPYSCVGGPFGSDLTTKDYVSSGVPVIRGANLNGPGRWMVEREFVFVSQEKAKALLRNLAYPGDIIFTQRGTLGQVARIHPASGGHCFVLSQSQMKLTVNAEVADPDFVTFYFESPQALDMIVRATVATGIPHINLGILRGFLVPIPPREEQRQIAESLDASECRGVAEGNKLKALSELKSALMSVLLTGEVRVRVDEDAAA